MAGYFGLPNYLADDSEALPATDEDEGLAQQIARDMRDANERGVPFNFTIGQPQPQAAPSPKEKEQVVRDYLMQKMPSQEDLQGASQKANIGSLLAGLTEAGGMIGSGFRSRPGEFNRANYEGLHKYSQQPLEQLQRQAGLAEHTQRMGIERAKEEDRISDRELGAEFDDPNSSVTRVLLESLRAAGIDPSLVQGVTARQLLKIAPGLKPVISFESLKSLEGMKNTNKLGQMEKKFEYDKELARLKVDNPWVMAKIGDMQTRKLKWIRDMEALQSPLLQLSDPNSPAPKGQETKLYEGVAATSSILHLLKELEDIYKVSGPELFRFGDDYKKAMIASKALVFKLNSAEGQKALTQGHQKLFEQMAPLVNDLGNIVDGDQFMAQVEAIRKMSVFDNNNALTTFKYKPMTYDEKTQDLAPPEGTPNPRAMSGVVDQIVGQTSPMSQRPPPAVPGQAPPAGQPAIAAPPLPQTAPVVAPPSPDLTNAQIGVKVLKHKKSGISREFSDKKAAEMLQRYPGAYQVVE